MVIPPGHEGPLHTHHDVEEVFFVLQGQMTCYMEKDGERVERTTVLLRRRDRDAGSERPADRTDVPEPGAQRRRRVGRDALPRRKRVGPRSAAAAAAEPLVARRRRRPEVVDVQRRDPVARQLGGEPVVERAEPAAAV